MRDASRDHHHGQPEHQPDKTLPEPVTAARDSAGTRLLALALLGVAAALVYAVVQLGSRGALG